MKILKKSITVLCAATIIMLALSLTYYLCNKDYLQGNSFHYLGASEVTAEQIAALGTQLTIGGEYGDLGSLELLENGIVKVDYDFYSKESYPFLNVGTFSYFDAPMVYEIRQEWLLIIVVVGMCIFAISMVYLVDKKKIVITDGFKRKAANVLWYLVHPRHIMKCPEAQTMYNVQLRDSVHIDVYDLGIVCVRTWKYKDGHLYSAGYGQACWETKTLLADKTPEETNSSGIYAIRLGVIHEWDFMKDLLGIVSLKGDWCEHADGVLRAERCDILHLIVSEYYRPMAGKLSSVYGIPVTVVVNPINGYLNWLLKDNGLDCMVHNSKIMGGSHGNPGARNKKREYTPQKTCRVSNT